MPPTGTHPDAPNREEWRAIPEWPNYEASNRGRVRSVIRGRPYVLKPSIQSGYHRYQLRNGSYSRTAYGHVLVLEAWVSMRPSPEHHASHVDGDRANNNLENLLWETRSENQVRKADHDSVYRGDDHWNSKLNPDKVREIRTRHAAGESRGDLAREFGLTRSGVARVINRETWKHI